MARPNTTTDDRAVHTIIYLADGCTRRNAKWHPSVDRDGIEVGAPIAGPCTPIVWPRRRRRPPRSPTAAAGRDPRHRGDRRTAAALSAARRRACRAPPRFRRVAPSRRQGLGLQLLELFLADRRPAPSGREALQLGGRRRAAGRSRLDVLPHRLILRWADCAACSDILWPRGIRYTRTPRYGSDDDEDDPERLGQPRRSWLRKMSLNTTISN